jgi:hypothetical protein
VVVGISVAIAVKVNRRPVEGSDELVNIVASLGHCRESVAGWLDRALSSAGVAIFVDRCSNGGATGSSLGTAGWFGRLLP